MARARKPATTRSPKKATRGPTRRACGLCGKTRAVTRTECCGNPICDDESEYVLFSYSRKS